ncbi:MAG TPA: prevent-host-death protein [Beijerinckiaceae bacterium]|jgi:antitoxin (DNA-binding transcriptional repressor) of toxin-antitoxin stability system|nr:prevent-host-death protein [Beijerinckiaceae bacterium]
MRSVGLKVLKNKLSEYVRLAEAGETVLVTDRDRVVAELRPPTVDHRDWLSDPVIARMVREGSMTLPTAPRGVPPRNPVMSSAALDEALRQDREDR